MSFDLDLPGGAVLTVHQGRPDVLPADDTAALVLPPPRRPRLAVVHPAEPGDEPDAFLIDLLGAADPERLDVLTGADFTDLDPGALDRGEIYDLVIFDRVAPGRLPGVPTLTIGAAPAAIDVTPAARAGGQRILSWERQHPLMRHVALDTIVFTGFGALELPPTAEPLARGASGPVIAALRARGARHVVVGFELIRSNWPLHVSFAVFVRNALDYLTLAADRPSGLALRPGETITARAAPDATTIRLLGPDGAAARTARVDPGAVTTLPPLSRAGLYETEGVARPAGPVAVSVLSDIESDLRPRASIRVNAGAAEATAVESAAPRELWPWLVAAGLALAAGEWLIYCRRLAG